MAEPLAIDGGAAVRSELLPYSKPLIDDTDIQAVTDVLKTDWLTTGPKVAEFEQVFAAFVGAEHAVAVSNGTAALHAAFFALDVQPGDEVIVPTMTFVADANAAVYQGALPVLVDCDPATLLIDPTAVQHAITERTKAIVAVDFAGQPADYDALRAVARERSIPIVADACHALGGADRGRTIGTLGDLNVFSFHAVKPLATGEGGMVATANPQFAQRMRQFRNHGINSDHRERHTAGSWYFEMQFLGYNYRLTDLQCALGMSQLKRVPEWTLRRQDIAAFYDKAFAGLAGVTPLGKRDDVSHAYHLYVVQLDGLSKSRADVFKALRAEGIGVNVHYIPIHLHPFYRERFGTRQGKFPHAERAYERMLSLPIFAGMADADAADTVKAFEKICAAFA